MVKIGDAYTLTREDVDIAHRLAEKRVEYNRSQGARSRRHHTDGSSQLETDFESIGGEIAFCRLFEVEPDLGCYKRLPYDAIYAGNKIDVKTTKYTNGCLMVPTHQHEAFEINQDPGLDYFALMIGKMPTYKFKGFRAASEVLDLDRIQTHRNGNKLGNPAYCVEQWALVETIYQRPPLMPMGEW